MICSEISSSLQVSGLKSHQKPPWRTVSKSYPLTRSYTRTQEVWGTFHRWTEAGKHSTLTEATRFPLNNMDKMLLSQVWEGHRLQAGSSQSYTGESVSEDSPEFPPGWWRPSHFGQQEGDIWSWPHNGPWRGSPSCWTKQAGQKGTHSVQKNVVSCTDFFWSLAIRPRPWKGLWISNKLNLQESGAIKTEWDNLIPALARQHLDATHYKMSCQFWFWAHAPKQVNPSLFVVPQQVKCFTQL